MRTVDTIIIEGDDLVIGSDDDVSDTSQISRITLICLHLWSYFVYIWSDYGDEIIIDKAAKVTKWTPAGKVSTRLSMKERGVPRISKKKKRPSKLKQAASKPKPPASKRQLSTRDSQLQLALANIMGPTEVSDDK